MEESTTGANIDLKLISDHTDDQDEGGELPDDLLQREDMKYAIAQAIISVDPPFTFGIYGDWGSGKTHFMKSVKKRLDTPDPEKGWNPNVVTVMFEAWRHQRDKHPEISMLGCLNKELNKLDDCNSEDEQKKQKSEAMKAALIKLIPSFEAGIEIGIPGVFSVNAKGSTDVSESIDEYKQTLEKQKEINFEIIDEQIRLKKRFDDLFKLVVGEEGVVPESDRIVFFIDDLDRCLDGTVIKMLEQIKLFLWNKHCVFVLGADHKVIEGVVRNGNYAQGRKYLEKIVNFPFYLPPLGNEVSTDFFMGKVTDKTDKERLTVEEKELIELFNSASIASKANLREMILLANTYKLNNYLTRKAINPEANGGTQYYEKITAVFTVLQTLHEETFNMICENRSGSEGENLKAFFTKPTDESTDTIALLFSRKNPASKDPESKAVDRIDLEAINEIRKWTWDHCSEIIDGLKGTDLLVYVRFLASQSAAKRGSEDTSDPSVWYEDDPWVWYKKRPLAGMANPAAGGDAISEAIARIGASAAESTLGTSPPIELDGYLWRVIKVERGEHGSAERALLLSEDIIGSGPIDKEPQDWNRYRYKWSESALWKKLNLGDWPKKHLPTLSDSGMIQENHPAEDGDDSGALGKVFLLSTDEANELLAVESRKATTPQGEADWWWLRSRDVDNPQNAANVNPYGYVNRDGWNRVLNRCGVRPALWLNLKS